MYGFSLKDMCQLMIDADVVIARVGNVERGNEEWNGNDMTGNGNAARNISIITCDIEILMVIIIMQESEKIYWIITKIQN